MLRFFGRRGFLQSDGWVPHTAEALQMAQGVFVSRFPSPDGTEVVYTLVNRRPAALNAPQLLSEEVRQLRHHFFYHLTRIFSPAPPHTRRGLCSA